MSQESLQESVSAIQQLIDSIGKLLVVIDSNPDVMECVFFTGLYKDASIPELIERLLKCKQIAELELKHLPDTKNMSRIEKVRYFMSLV